MTDLYRIPAKPAIYNGIPMKSTLEAQTARALSRIGVDWTYERDRFADDEAFYTPDFHVPSIAVLGADLYTINELYVETRPNMIDEGLRRKAERNAATLAASTPAPLIFVGLSEFPTTLLGWCYGAKINPVLAAIGIRRAHSRMDQRFRDSPAEPCLYLDDYAACWIDGFFTAQEMAAKERG